MIRVCFICLGNICRSTMAEFLFKHMVEKRGVADKFWIESRGTSNEVEGDGVYEGTRKILDSYAIDYSAKRSTPLETSDGEKFDYFIGMDTSNIANILRIIGKQKSSSVKRLLDYTPLARDIADPWYTRDFQQTHEDIVAGLEGFLESLGE